ncbi:MAG TPA: hypothetical protein PLQ19_02425 [Aeromicrobium sp.]|nr:hypothetical protein [Aeromicrobium sp.]
MIRQFVVVPPVPALLPRYRSSIDPVADLRASALDVVAAMTRDAEEVSILGSDRFAGAVGRALLAGAGYGGRVTREAPVALVMANGSAMRSEKAPGHLDDRAFDFDDAVDLALRSGDPLRLSALDAMLGTELWASGIDTLRDLGQHLTGSWRVSVPHADAPYGVLWWVCAWVRAD